MSTTLAALTEADRDALPCECTKRHEHHRPLALVDITGGAEQATYYYPGVGDPIVEVQDFDAVDIDDDQREHLADRAELFARHLRERSDHPDDVAAADRYELDAREWREDLAESAREARRAAPLADAEPVR